MPVIALGALDAVFQVLMVMLIAFAVLELAKVLAHLLARVPVVGGWIGTNLTAQVDAAAAWAWSKFWGHAVTAGHWISSAYSWASQYTNLAADAAGAIATTVYHIARLQIPREIANAKAYALAKVNAARTYAEHLAANAGSDLVNKITAARAYALSLVATARHDLNLGIMRARADAAKALAAAEAAAATDVAAAKAEARHLFSVAEADTTAAVKALEATTAAGLASVASDAIAGVKEAEKLAHDLSQAAVIQAGVITDLAGVKGLEALWGDITDTAGAVAGALPGDLSDLSGLLKGLEGAGLATLTGALSALGVVSLTQLRFLEECGLPNCRNLGPLAKFLEALLGGVEDAALLAFLIMMAHDPRGAAHMVEEVAAPVLHDTVTGLRDLIGA